MTTGFEYLALGILLLGLTMLIYALVWLHGIPHQIAEKNNHPHKSAIHVACWLSVFTLHALWPLVYLWAIMPDKKLAVEVTNAPNRELLARIAALETELASVKKSSSSVETLNHV